MTAAYIYAAALHCAACGEAIRAALDAEGKRPDDVQDESSYDSDAYPKGPYGEGGGEADSPQHCDSCGEFLDNVLTEDGSTYVKAAWREFVENGRGRVEVLQEWIDAYPCEWSEYAEATEGEIEENRHTDLAVRRFHHLAGEAH